VIQDTGLNPYYFEMANIREQCSWHPAGELTTQSHAMVASAVAKGALLQPLEQRRASVTPAALVIGGIAGVAALTSPKGFETLVERSPAWAARGTTPPHVPTLEPTAGFLEPLIDRHPAPADPRRPAVMSLISNTGNQGQRSPGADTRDRDRHDHVATGFDA
jgi:heterodisulfide reductase subunit A